MRLRLRQELGVLGVRGTCAWQGLQGAKRGQLLGAPTDPCCNPHSQFNPQLKRTLSLPRKPLPPIAQSLVIWGHVNTPRAE